MSQKNFIKRQLTIINEYFRRKEDRLKFKPNQENSKIDRKYTVTKNFMRLLNKTMIGINKIQINKRQFFYGFLGIGLGYLCGECETFVTNFHQNYQKDIKKALIQHVLKNQSIKNSLSDNLLQNVYTNKDIQFNLHQNLYWKAIKPQQKNLFYLCKGQIISVLNKNETKESLSNLIAESIRNNQSIIAQLTLDFLQSDQMDRVVAKQLSNLLKSQMLSRLFAQSIIKFSNTELQKQNNRDSLYQFLRYKYMNF